jgi:diacylglycerol kinase (ATP)
VGLDADVAVAAARLKKYPFLSGQRLYLASILRQVFFGYQRSPWLTLSLDGGAQGEGEEKRYVIMAVSNGPSYGGGFQINPGADHADGLFDICAFDYMSLWRFLQLMPVVRRGQHAAAPEAAFYQARSLRIESRAPINIQLDGEVMQASSVHAEVLPAALEVRV